MDSQQGISFTEFSYQLLQAYDFYVLYKHHRCNIQLGGSDQWGNVVAGLELINRLDETGPEQKDDHSHRETAFGITTPLLTTASGEKFGKSAGNAIWLHDQLTSVFDFYQVFLVGWFSDYCRSLIVRIKFFLKTADADVEKYLKMFTLLPIPTIHDVLQSHRVCYLHLFRLDGSHASA
jgi:tyrosyl-tRNA synthetase